MSGQHQAITWTNVDQDLCHCIASLCHTLLTPQIYYWVIPFLHSNVRTAPSHYLNQCWPRSMSLHSIIMPYSVNTPNILLSNSFLALKCQQTNYMQYMLLTGQIINSLMEFTWSIREITHVTNIEHYANTNSGHYIWDKNMILFAYRHVFHFHNKFTEMQQNLWLMGINFSK